MADVVAYTVEFVRETAQVLRNRRGLLAGGRGRHAGLVVVTGLLDDKAPLVGERHLADGLGTEGTVDLARGGVALLGGAVVLDTATVAHEIVARRLGIAVVGGAKLDNAIAVVFRDALDGGQEVVKRAVDAFGGRDQSRGGRRGHGRAGGDHLAGGRHGPNRCGYGNRTVCSTVGTRRCTLVLGDRCRAGHGGPGAQAPRRRLLRGVGSQRECLSLRQKRRRVGVEGFGVGKRLHGCGRRRRDRIVVGGPWMW